MAFSAVDYSIQQSAKAATILVNRSGTPTAAASVQYATSDGSGTAGSLYTATTGTLQWTANDASPKTISVPVSSAAFSGNKSFKVALSNPSADAALSTPSSATVVVSGTAVAGTLQLSAATYTASQTASSVALTVTRSGGSNGAVSVAYATGGGSAMPGTNYTSTSGTLNWADGDASSKNITIPINKSASITANVTFNVTLSTAGGGATVGSTAVSTVTLTPPTAAASTAMSIKVSGGHFVDQNGKTVQLRGVNISALEGTAVAGWSPSNPWGSQTGDPTPNWKTLGSWDTNAVRLPLNEDSWLGLSCTDVGGFAGTPGATINADPGNNYRATVEQGVAAANAAGLYVILDLHWSAPNQNGTPICATAQNAMADSDHAIAFWTSVATQFKGNPAVIFELFNEPFINSNSGTQLGDSTWQELLNGGTVGQVTYNGYNGASSGTLNLSWSTAGMQQMLNAVRATGATNVVLTSTLQWSSQIDGWLQYKPNDSAGQLGAVWHTYPASTTQAACVSDNIISVGFPGCAALEMAAAQSVVAAGYPVVITEFGDAIGGSTAPFASQMLPFADSAGISYLGWTWDTWNQSSNVLITDAAGDPTAGYGTYVKQHYLCRAAGTSNCP